MLTTAFDVSYDEPHRRFTVMAGFVSETAAWVDFDKEWRERLAKDGLSYFHMQPFAQSGGPFKGWASQEDRRRKLLGDLLDIIASHVRQKFACVVLKDAMGVFSDEVTQRFGDIPLAVAGSFIIGLVLDWRDREKYLQRNPEFIFEEGDLGKGKLADVFLNHVGYRPIFRPKKDDPSKKIEGFTPLQAADILAYEVKKVADKIDTIRPEVYQNYRFRFGYEQLNKIHGEPKIANADSAAIGNIWLETERYFAKNPLGGQGTIMKR